MDIAAKVTTQGQITIPKDVLDALGIQEGDRIIFRVEEGRAVLLRTPDLLDLAGSVDVPASVQGASWEQISDTARRHYKGVPQ